MAFDHKWFGDQFVIYGDLYYQNAASHDELAPSATGSFQTAGQVTLAIPPHSNLNGVAPPLTPTFEDTQIPPDAFNPFNPFNQIISGASRARLLEFGNRLFDNTTDSFLVTLGARGDKLFDGTWGYDFGFRYSQVKATEHDTLTSTSRFNRILNQNDPIFQEGGILEGQPAFNPFGDAQAGNIPANAATTAFATVHPNNVSTSELGTLDLNIYTTELFKLPAGGIGFAFGGQFRREQLTQDIDQLFLDGDIIGIAPAASTQAGRKDWALYAEGSLPVFSPTFNVPGAYALEFTAAVRYEVFENNNTNVAVPKFGMRWQPFDETFTVRATWGEGFREPSLIELYASPTSGLVGSTDILPTSLGGPATPVGDPSRIEPETPVVVTSSPVLQPEDSRSFSAGIVWTPKWVNGLTLSIDLWNIEQTGVVIASTTTQVLAERACAAEGTGGFAPGEAVERNPDGTISRIFTPFVNSGNTQTNGIDMGLQYVYPTKFGTFTSVTNATWVNTFQQAVFADQPQKELNGYTTDPNVSVDGFLKWKGVSRLDWAWNGWDLVGTVNFLDGFHERYPNGLLHYTSQTWFFDGQLSYDFTFVPPVENQPVAGYSKDAKDMTMGKDGKATESAVAQTSNVALPIWKQVLNGTQITIGCNDIFGQDPPRAYGFGGNPTNYPGFLYDSTGRFVYVQLTKKF